MKTILCVLVILPVFGMRESQTKKISGAWRMQEGTVTHTLSIVDDYYSLVSFDIPNRKFIHTEGGPYRVQGDDMVNGEVEYNTTRKDEVGSTFAYSFSLKGDRLSLYRNGKDETWERVDDGKGPLAGNWRITGRDQGGKMVEIKPAARKTIKILSATRFQWAAINSETGDFFGTGGGTYTFKDGKYTEHIEFFSRDSSRVGMSLGFDGRVEGRNWHHSGKSSKGDPINEVWSR
jgi:hypothetical protein